GARLRFDAQDRDGAGALEERADAVVVFEDTLGPVVHVVAGQGETLAGSALTRAPAAASFPGAPQARSTRAHEPRQDPAGSSGKCSGRRYGSPGASCVRQPAPGGAAPVDGVGRGPPPPPTLPTSPGIARECNEQESTGPSLPAPAVRRDGHAGARLRD